MKRKKKVSGLDDATTEIILESISDGVFTVDHNWRIMSFNRAAEEITGITRHEAVGRHCWEVFRSNMCEGDCALKRTMKEGSSIINSSTSIISADMKRIPITVSTSLLKDRSGHILGGVETFRDHSLEESLRKELQASCELGDMVSGSPEMKKIFSLLPLVAESDAPVLIEGETGTGKELTARAIHGLSGRREKPFVAINCGALPDTLLESELFGYRAGAFTNAVKDKPGYFAVAQGGTILLDEIGDTSPAFQVKLLRVLEEYSYQPLGSTEKTEADIRILAATNRDLGALKDRGDFRPDLFYRINVIRIALPPLRKRLEDIPLLIDRVITRLNHVRGKTVTAIHPEVLKRLMTHSYPGNIRELENIIEHAFILCRGGEILPEYLPSSLIGHHLDTPTDATAADSFAAAQRSIILKALRANNYNRRATAAALGIHKSTLFRKIRKLGLDIPGRRPRPLRDK